MKKVRVLMIEDSKFAADINLRYLKKSGLNIDCLVVSDKAAMKDALLEKKWDIILSDNCMPNFSALGALYVRNEINADIPFVIVSEYMTEDDVKKAYSIGITAFVSKANLYELTFLAERLF